MSRTIVVSNETYEKMIRDQLKPDREPGWRLEEPVGDKARLLLGTYYVGDLHKDKMYLSIEWLIKTGVKTIYIGEFSGEKHSVVIDLTTLIS